MIYRHRIRVCEPFVFAWAALVLLIGCIRLETGEISQVTDAKQDQHPAESEVAAAADIDTGDVAETDGAVAGTDGTLVASSTSDAKPVREPIYDGADGSALIAAAIDRAEKSHKHVLIEWGGNWCGWCYKLHDVFTNNEVVRPIVHEDYELVLIDESANHKLMTTYGGKERQYSFPHLTILDAHGNVLVNQNTEPLEDGPQHDPQAVAEFLEKWAPQPIDAEAQLASALQRATAEEKLVLMHVGTPYCGWCKVLNEFLIEHHEVFSADYVDLYVDTLRMTNGNAVADRLKPGDGLGVPWMVILDASGEVVANSVGPEGNIGYPVQSHEIDHFLRMLKSTAQHMSEIQLAEIRSALEGFREARVASAQAVD